MTRPWVRPALAALGVVVLVAVSLTALLHVGFQPPKQRAPRAQAAAPTPAATTPTPAPPPSPSQRLIPGTLVIPKIGVRATIEQVTVDSNDDMATPQKPADVGWYSPGIAPGQAGDAVIDGHLDWYGVPKAVFYYLSELQPGDQVDVVSQGGVELAFRVTDSALVGRTAHPAGLFATGGTPRLTLITCAGDWNPTVGEYGERLLVDATLIGTT